MCQLSNFYLKYVSKATYRLELTYTRLPLRGVDFSCWCSQAIQYRSQSHQGWKRPPGSASPTVIKYQFQTFSTLIALLTDHNRLFRGVTPTETCYVIFCIMISFLLQRLYLQRCLILQRCLAQECRSHAYSFSEKKNTILLSNVWKNIPKDFFTTDMHSFPEVFVQKQDLRQKYRSHHGEGESKKASSTVHVNTFLCTAWAH